MLQVRVSEVYTNLKAKALFCSLVEVVDLALTGDSGGFRPVLPPSAIVKLVGENQHLEDLAVSKLFIVQDFRQKMTEETILDCALYYYILFNHSLTQKCIMMYL